MKNKLLFLILLIGIVGVFGFIPSVILAEEGKAKVVIDKCPSSAVKGETIIVKANIENTGDKDEMLLIVYWNKADDWSGTSPSEITKLGWKQICQVQNSLDKGNFEDCQDNFIMPEKNVFVRAWGFHKEGSWVYDNATKVKKITLKEPGEEEEEEEEPGEEPGEPGVGITFKNPLEYDDFGKLVDGIVNFIFNIAIVIVPLAIIIGAFFLLISGGDTEKIKTGKNIILYALIGLVIVLFAKGLISMIESILKVEIGG